MAGPLSAAIDMLRQRDAFAQRQALAFALERSELERNATDARLRLLQAQVQPRFLFNTLADEPLLRGALQRLLMQAWPELELVAEAPNGREAIELFEASMRVARA